MRFPGEDPRSGLEEALHGRSVRGEDVVSWGPREGCFRSRGCPLPPNRSSVSHPKPDKCSPRISPPPAPAWQLTGVCPDVGQIASFLCWESSRKGSPLPPRHGQVLPVTDEAPRDLAPVTALTPSPISLCSGHVALRGSPRFLEHPKHTLASGPSHLPCPLLVELFPGGPHEVLPSLLSGLDSKVPLVERPSLTPAPLLTQHPDIFPPTSNPS